MKQQEYSVLKGEFDILLNVPGDYDEFDKALGEIGAALGEGTDNIIYRNTLPRLYTGVSKALEETGKTRKVVDTKTNADGTVKEVKESVMSHIERILVENPEFKTELGDIFAKVAAGLAFYEKGERTGGGGKISQQAIDGANAILAQGQDRVDKVIAYIESTVPGYKVGRDLDLNVTPESLARAIQSLNKHMEREAKKAASGALGL